LKEMYPVDCDNALSTGFLTVEGSPHEEEFVANNATGKSKNKFRGLMVGGEAP